MSIKQTWVLIPSHGLEDLPTDLGEEAAAGLLHAFAIGWHPRVLLQTRSRPGWWRADDPPPEANGALFVLPSCSRELLPEDFEEDIARRGGSILPTTDDRAKTLQSLENLLDALEHSPATENGPTSNEPGGDSGQAAAETEAHIAASIERPDVSDFLALGLAVVLLEMLSRHMHYFSELDDVLLEREAVAAAEAWQASDEATMRSRLQRCFDSLAESREHFYAAECYLFDVCLLDTEFADGHFARCLDDWQRDPASVLVSGRALAELQSLADGTGASVRPPRSRSALPDASAARTALEGLRKLVRAGRVAVIGGEFGEKAAPLIPLPSWLYDLQRGRSAYRRILGIDPACWGRQRYGLSPHLPQLLRAAGYHQALHFVLDDGLYPDVEQLTFRWEAPDGTQLLAVNRLPLAADSATSMLHLPARLGDSMQEDQVAGLLLCHWPELRRPWLNDLKTICRYAPVFGTFRELSVLKDSGETFGRLSQYRPDEYLTPFLSQWTAYGEADPVSRLVVHHRNRWRFDALKAAAALAWAVSGRACRGIDWPRLEALVEAAGADAYSPDFADDPPGALAEVFPQSDTVSASESRTGHSGTPADAPQPPSAPADTHAQSPAPTDVVSDQAPADPAGVSASNEPSQTPTDTAVGALAKAVSRQAERARRVQTLAGEALDRAATLVARELLQALTVPAHDATPARIVFNPLSFQRRWLWQRPAGSPVAAAEAVKAVQHDEDATFVLLDLPPCGFAAVPEHGTELPLLESPAPLAEETLLQNEYFEVDLHPETGGIARVKLHGRNPNRLSQMLAFRFLREQTVTRTDEQGEMETTTTYYSVPRCEQVRVLRSGPLVGEIETRGTLLHPTDHSVLAEFVQRVRVTRGQRHFDLFIELQPRTAPTGAPWATYYACRWAYHDSTAALSALHWETVHPFGSDRIESPLGLEIATETERTAIATGGLAFHRRTGPRMIDTLLLVENETARRFRFRVSVDVPYPAQTAADLLVEPLVIPCRARKPAAQRAWLLHVDRRNVLVREISREPLAIAAAGDGSLAAVSTPSEAPDSPSGDPGAAQDRVHVGAASSTATEPYRGGPGESAGDSIPDLLSRDDILWLRVIETDGRPTVARLECFRPIAAAWLIDPGTDGPRPLAVEDAAVPLEVPPYAIRTLALRLC